MFQMIKAELGKIWQNKMLLITVLAICCVPILYAGFFLKGVWDPYGNLDSIKVAVVNEDQPVDYNEQTLNVGNQVVDTLKKDDTFDWQFVNADQADQGMDDNTYYMVVTLPQDMSAKAATVTNADPEQLDIKYETNGSLNFPLETISSTAADKIKSRVSSQVALAYANSLISTIKSTGDSLQTAADGAGQLTDGAKQVNDGANQLVSGTASLADGVDQLVNQTRASGTQVQNSLPQLATLNDGANQLASQLSSSASTAKAQMAKVDQLLSNPASLQNPRTLAALKQQLAQIPAQLQTAADGASQVAAGTNQVYNQMSNMSNQLNSQQTQTQLNQLSSGAKQLSDGASQLTTGTKQLVDGSSELQTKLQAGANTIKSTPLSDKTAQQIAEPVKTEQSKHSDVKNYGHGLAPYFMSVALFVGCMMFTLAYPVRKKANLQGSWLGWYASKAFISIVSATVMAVIEASIMLAIGLQVDNVAAFYGTLILYGNAVMALCMFLAVAFDNPGRFVAMLVLILSLSASGGTFPVETSSAFYDAVHPFVPITYSLSALRSSISGGIASSSVHTAYLYFTVIFIACTALTALAMFILNKFKGSHADRSRTDGNEDLFSDDYSNYKLKRA